MNQHITMLHKAKAPMTLLLQRSFIFHSSTVGKRMILMIQPTGALWVQNFFKNIFLDSCTFSRFDAHQCVANATIKNSTLGLQGINAIGSGKMVVENCTVYGNNLINLRSDYGSTWQCELLLRNCVFIPADGKATSVNLIGGANNGQHNFGYTCYLPERITIENLHIDGAQMPTSYKGPAIFANFNAKLTDNSYQESFP